MKIKVGLNDAKCNDDDDILCKSESGLSCSVSRTCQCSSPKSWDVNSKKCDSCINGYTNLGSGTPCS